MTTEHKYAEVLRAIADGVPATEFEVYSLARETWIDVRESNILDCLIHGTPIRRKPRVISINGIDFPEPCREPLEIGQRYFCPFLAPRYEDATSISADWNGDYKDMHALKHGFVHLTRDAARKHHLALKDLWFSYFKK